MDQLFDRQESPKERPPCRTWAGLPLFQVFASYSNDAIDDQTPPEDYRAGADPPLA